MSDLFNATGEGRTVSSAPAAVVGPAQVAALRMYVDEMAGRLWDFSPGSAPGRDYLARFGLTDDQAAELELGYDDGATGSTFPYVTRAFTKYPRLVVPFRDFTGIVRGLQGRDVTGKCLVRWCSLGNPDGLVWQKYGYFQAGSGFDQILICEGPSDALTAVGVGYDAIAVRGAGLARSESLVRELVDGLRGRVVILAGDNDTAGETFTADLTRSLRAAGITVRLLDIPKQFGDLNAWRADDPERFTAKLHAAVRSAREPEQESNSSLDLAERTGAAVVSSDEGSEAARMLDKLIERYGDSDAMNAHALVAWTEGRIKYAPGLGYMVWNGTVWQSSEVKVRQEIHRMGAALLVAGKTDKAKPFTMTTRIDNLMTELRSVPNVHVAAAEFDAQPDLLSFRNGVVELRTGTLRPHRKEDMLTVTLPFNYEAGAQCPRWEAFLAEIMPGMPEMPAYLRRLIGYGITGYTTEQCFAVLLGKGANGKSVLTDAITDVFGQITKTTPFDTFEEKKGGGIPNDIAALRDARLVMASEGEAGKPMSESVIKRLTGKDKVTARFLRQEFFTFQPTFLIMLATNHRPAFKGQDDGLWRRVKLIPFNRYFAPHERDYDLGDKLLSERAGIVAWAVRGAVEWFAGGLQDPEVVRAATKNYRETSDALFEFFPGVLVKGEDSDVVPAQEAFNLYLEWCEENNLPLKERWTKRAFLAAMDERGVPRTRRNSGMVLVGVKIAGVATGPAGPGIFSGE
ncbi:phage/plasmid primase, P4 family [Streptomyces sp. NPDC090442]|uniref:phage/plasmid primase, P4 family n=1 Tax=Streptomyces sp. NPDC090442 TaxID=3365962 RepID=UPI0037FE340D